MFTFASKFGEITMCDREAFEREGLESRKDWRTVSEVYEFWMKLFGLYDPSSSSDLTCSDRDPLSTALQTEKDSNDTEAEREDSQSPKLTSTATSSASSESEKFHDYPGNNLNRWTSQSLQNQENLCCFEPWIKPPIIPNFLLDEPHGTFASIARVASIASSFHTCNICAMIFDSKDAYNDHLRSHVVDYSIKKSNADGGNYVSNNSNLDVNTDPTGNRPYKCQFCSKSFKNKSHARDHVRIHTGERPFKCEYCVKSFIKKGDLNVHIRTHTGERPFKCQKCDKSFIKNSDLTKHKCGKLDRRHKCQDCDKVFSRKTNLVEHARTHTV